MTSIGTHIGQWLLVWSLATGFVLAATPTALQSSDEEAIRALTEAYGRAVGASDLAKMREFWDPQSPDLASRLRVYRSGFAQTRYELIRMEVTRLEVAGGKAVSYLTSDEHRLDTLTGVVVTDRSTYHGLCRSLEWVRVSGGWKIEHESLIQDELSARFEAAATESERDKILEQERSFITDAFLGALLARGVSHFRLREYDKSRRCLELTRALAEKMGDSIMVAAALLNTSLIDWAEGNNDAALLIDQRALALYQTAGSDIGTANTLRILAGVYKKLGNYWRAFEYGQEALRQYEKSKVSRGIADTLLVLADVYSDQNDFQQALAQVERATAIYEQLGDRIQTAVSRHSMAGDYAGLGNYDQARKIYEELLKQTEGFGDAGGAAVLRNAIGDTWAEQGRYSEALDYYRQALSAVEAVKYIPGIGNALLRVGQAYEATEDYREALPYLERAVSLEREMNRPSPLAAGLTALGYCRLGLNQPSEARHAFAEAIEITEKLRAQTAGGVEESRHFLEGRLRAYHGMLTLVVKQNQPGEALALAERTKARVLLDVLDNGKVNIEKAMTPEEREHERRLKSSLTSINVQVTASQSGASDPQRLRELQSRLEKARLDYEAYQASLYAAHPELKIQRAEAPIIDAKELSQLLPDTSTTLLEYVVTDEQSYLLAITKTGEGTETNVRIHALPIKRLELAKQIEAFRQQLGGRDLGFRASAAKLYELLLKPAEAEIKGRANLVIVPDDSLWDLPFQALLTSRNRFLIEDAAVSYAPSLTVLREMIKRQEQHKPSGTFLAIGNPTVSGQTIARARMVSRDEKLVPLPEAEREVTELGHLYGAARSKVYVGAEAREERVKLESAKAGTLHFATHGILNNMAPMYSHLVLAQGDRNEDGLLEAWELIQLELKADLVVLSACETARGRYGAGEGIIGLSWALFVAGVPATVVSQWKVEAASTRDLMVSFHRPLSASSGARVTRAEALRQAELKLMKNRETSHPFYWAGFVLVGDGR